MGRAQEAEETKEDVAVSGEAPGGEAPEQPPQSAEPEDPFLATVHRTIREVVTSGTHPGIRWTRFPYYRDELEKIYGPRNYLFFWFTSEGVRPLADEVIALLDRAEENGLHPRDYDAAMLAAKLEAIRNDEVLEPAELARFDTALTMGLLRYISDLHIGRINPKNLHFGLNIEEKKYDLAVVLNGLLERGDVAGFLEEAQPPIPIYERIKRLLPVYEELASRPGLQPLPVVEPVLRPGEPYRFIPELVRFLVAVGDLSEEELGPDYDPRRATIYEGALVEGVKRFQGRHGLMQDGILGPATFGAMNVPLSDRVRSIKMALERLRWLPDLRDVPFVVVNIPGFQLFAFERGNLGAPALEMSVIVGSAINKTKTPIFSDRMTYLDFSPYWNVMLPKILSEPGYLEQEDLELVTEFSFDAQPLRLTREAVDGIATGDVKIRQRPGPQNALGLVKFIFPNAHNVYLHSTPQQQLFSETRRDFSHGCIRVEKPRELAEWVLRDQPDWNRPRIDAAMDGGRPQRVFLKEPLPVFIFYTSVVAREDVVFFYPDIYGHDENLERALAKGYPYDP